MYDRVVAAGEAFVGEIEGIDRSSMTQALRDRLDELARRYNAASEKNVYGFVTSE